MTWPFIPSVQAPRPSAESGIHFTDPGEFFPYCAPAADTYTVDSGSVSRAFDTTAAFTEMARRGLQEQTNWTADTYKTLLSVTSGRGFVAAMCGPTAGGAETTTFEITVDGVLRTIAVAGLASGERAFLVSQFGYSGRYITSNDFNISGAETLDADKATFGAPRATSFIPPWNYMFYTPCLKFSNSLLIRAKHSANITNSTATAYSFVMYRNLL